MSKRAKTLLTLIAIAVTLYAGAIYADRQDLSQWIFIGFLVSAGLAEIMFWIQLLGD